MNKIVSALLIITAIGCNSEEKADDTKTFFPVNSYLNSQVAHVDTSLFQIVQIRTIDEISDTTYIPREKFRDVAKDFLTVPDISSKKLKKNYTESEIVDEVSNTIVFNYMPKKQDMEVKRVDVTIEPNPSASGDKVTSIFIDQWVETGDSLVQKKMMWYIDKSFQVTKIIQTPNQKERIVRTEVTWNDHLTDDQAGVEQ